MRLNINKLLLTMAKQEINFTELSTRCNVSRTTLSYLKSGKRCTPKTVGRIAAALGVQVEDIIETEGDNL